MTSRRSLLGALTRTAAAAAVAPSFAGRALSRFAASGAQPQRDVSGPNSLPAHAARRGLLTGCAVNVGRLEVDLPYTELVRRQATIVVAENDMKWGPMRPTSTTFDFSRADKLVAFAESNGMKIRGHNLCWHRQLPTWFEAEATSANARALLTGHIDKVAGRYAGRIHSWDVVNEAVQVSDGRPDGLRNSPWLQLLGPDYLEIAFHQARLADPKALLTYNDYDIESEAPDQQAKRNTVLQLLRRLKSRNVPLDAVGIQSHIKAGPKHTYGPGLTRFMQDAETLGLQIFLTEMDVNDRDLPADNVTRDLAVAERYGQYLDVALRNHQVRAVLTWGITDRYTWLNGEDSRPDHLHERCLPFDADLQPVPAYFALRTAYDHRPI